MALTREDKRDVASRFGKALANKVSRVTHDYPTLKVERGQVKGSSAKADASFHYGSPHEKVLKGNN